MEALSWKDKATEMEFRVNRLQSAVLENEKQAEHALAQRSDELASVEARVRSLQDSNEMYQQQAKQATAEKERVAKDYLQVVYDLGKAQKQLNSMAKETVSITEKDVLLREIDQLQNENQQLAQKVKEAEVGLQLSVGICCTQSNAWSAGKESNSNRSRQWRSDPNASETNSRAGGPVAQLTAIAATVIFAASATIVPAK